METPQYSFTWWGVVKLFNNINSNEDKYLGHHFPLLMNGYYFEASIL